MDGQTLETARNVAFRFLGYAPRSRAEIERRLQKDDYAPDIIAAICDEMAAQGWLDDTRFAHDWIADRADRKRYGRGRLAAELRTRGIDKETLNEALEDVSDEQEVERALAAAQGKWKPDIAARLDRNALEAEKRKLAAFLQRRGFAWPIIKQVMTKLTPNQE